MRIATFTAFSLVSIYAYAASGVEGLTAKSAVSEFSLQCQHPALKPNPDQRADKCLDQVKKARERVAVKKSSAECWKQLEELSFTPIFDAMFSLALDPGSKKSPSGRALEDVFVIAAPACE